MESKFKIFIKGLFLTFLALIVFGALGWININSAYTGAKVLTPVLMALIIWTAMYFLGTAIWMLLLVFTGCTFGIGFFIGLGVLGYIAMQLAIYFLPNGWVTYSTNDGIILFLMGCGIAAIDFVVDDEKRTSISIGNTSDNKRRKDKEE